MSLNHNEMRQLNESIKKREVSTLFYRENNYPVPRLSKRDNSSSRREDYRGKATVNTSTYAIHTRMDKHCVYLYHNDMVVQSETIAVRETEINVPLTH